METMERMETVQILSKLTISTLLYANSTRGRTYTYAKFPGIVRELPKRVALKLTPHGIREDLLRNPVPSLRYDFGFSIGRFRPFVFSNNNEARRAPGGEELVFSFSN